MLKGFKEFLFRGNLIDLAVAVVIALALVAVIGSVTENLIYPIIAAIGPADSIGLGFQIRETNPNTFVDIGAIINAIITFVIIAAVVYFVVVVPMKKVTERFKKDEAPAEVPADVALLTEIRDLLLRQSGGTGATGSAPPPGSTV